MYIKYKYLVENLQKLIKLLGCTFERMNWE